MTTMDFGLDWKEFEKGGVKYRERTVNGVYELQMWVTSKDSSSMGRWEALRPDHWDVKAEIVD